MSSLVHVNRSSVRHFHGYTALLYSIIHENVFPISWYTYKYTYVQNCVDLCTCIRLFMWRESLGIWSLVLSRSLSFSLFVCTLFALPSVPIARYSPTPYTFLSCQRSPCNLRACFSSYARLICPIPSTLSRIVLSVCSFYNFTCGAPGGAECLVQQIHVRSKSEKKKWSTMHLHLGNTSLQDTHFSFYDRVRTIALSCLPRLTPPPHPTAATTTTFSIPFQFS